MNKKEIRKKEEVVVEETAVEKMQEMQEVLVPLPKKIFYVESHIDLELFEKLVQFVNEYGDSHIIEVWLNSPGGDCMAAEMIRDLIEEYQMPIVGCYLIGSAAFNIFMTANVYKRLVPGTKGIFHRSFYSNIRMDESFKPMIDSEFKRFMGENFRTVDEAVAKIPLDAKQKRKFKRNEDINFTYEELINIIKSLNDENFILDNQQVVIQK